MPRDSRHQTLTQIYVKDNLFLTTLSQGEREWSQKERDPSPFGRGKLTQRVRIGKVLGEGCVILLLFWLSLAASAFGQTSNPQGLAPSSGSVGTGFAAAGETAAGIIANADLRGGVGMVASAFAPLLPPTAAVASLEGFTGAIIAYPSPFNPATQQITIAYRHTRDETINVYIMDIAGVVVKQIRTNSATTRSSDGYSRITWDGAGADTGVYLVQVTADGKIIGRTKVIVIR